MRRSLYAESRRTKLLSMLDIFDAPQMEPNCTLRTVSTVAPQALMLMNSPFVLAQSRTFAERVQSEAGDCPVELVNRAWFLAYGSEPAQDERDACVEFLRDQTQLFQTRDETAADAGKGGAGKGDAGTDATDPALQALASLCQVLLESNQFIYVE